MALERRRLTTRTVFFLCMLLGIVLGASYGALTRLVNRSIQNIPNLRADIKGALKGAEPLLSETAAGLLLFGLSSYLIARAFIKGYAKVILNSLSAEMRRRNLLPYQFEAKRLRRRTWDYQEGALFLLDSYVERLQEAEVQKEKYKHALSSYADPTVQERLKYETDQMKIKSDKKRVAVLFSDIRGFTRISEKMLPEEVVLLLNDYFAFSTEAVKKNKGSVNKFIGDAVMALFEDPPAYKEEESASRNAINAALSIVEEFHTRLPEWKERLSSNFDCDIGVGVHYGEAILGNLGSTERMEFTAIGDTVNFASRLCSLAKAGQVVVSEPCFEKIHDYFEGAAQEPVAVKNKSGLHTTYVVRRRKSFT